MSKASTLLEDSPGRRVIGQAIIPGEGEIMTNRVPPRIKKLLAAKRRLLDRLLEKNAEGQLSSAEKSKLQQLVAEAEELAVANAQRLAEFSESENGACRPMLYL